MKIIIVKVQSASEIRAWVDRQDCDWAIGWRHCMTQQGEVMEWEREGPYRTQPSSNPPADYVQFWTDPGKLRKVEQIREDWLTDTWRYYPL